MKKYLTFKPNPFRPIDYTDEKRWRKEGPSYKLFNPDMEKDRQFLTVGIKKIGEGLDQNKKLYIYGVANANIVDRMEERLDPRGLELDDYLKNKQLLAHHSYYFPVGQVEEMDIQEDGVKFTAWIGDPEKGPLTEMQKEIRSLVAQGILKAVSVGFIPKKVRPPAFDDNGAMVEPCVIEQWELLELSVVAVPANQDSLFDMKGFASSFDSAKLVGGNTPSDVSNHNKAQSFESIMESLAEENMVVQTLIFDKDVFSEDEAKKWAKDHGFRSTGVDETEDSYRIRQEDPDDFDQDSFRTITLTEGVQAVVGKKKKDGEENNSNSQENTGDDSQENKQEEIVTLLRTISESMKRNTEMTEKVYEKLYEEKPEMEDDEEEDEEEGKNTEDDSVKTLEKRMENLEDQFSKMVDSLEKIAGKLSE